MEKNIFESIKSFLKQDLKAETISMEHENGLSCWIIEALASSVEYNGKEINTNPFIVSIHKKSSKVTIKLIRRFKNTEGIEDKVLDLDRFLVDEQCSPKLIEQIEGLDRAGEIIEMNIPAEYVYDKHVDAGIISYENNVCFSVNINIKAFKQLKDGKEIELNEEETSKCLIEIIRTNLVNMIKTTDAVLGESITIEESEVEYAVNKAVLIHNNKDNEDDLVHSMLESIEDKSIKESVQGFLDKLDCMEAYEKFMNILLGASYAEALKEIGAINVITDVATKEYAEAFDNEEDRVMKITNICDYESKPVLLISAMMNTNNLVYIGIKDASEINATVIRHIDSNSDNTEALNKLKSLDNTMFETNTYITEDNTAVCCRINIDLDKFMAVLESKDSNLHEDDVPELLIGTAVSEIETVSNLMETYFKTSETDTDNFSDRDTWIKTVESEWRKMEHEELIKRESEECTEIIDKIYEEDIKAKQFKIELTDREFKSEETFVNTCNNLLTEVGSYLNTTHNSKDFGVIVRGIKDMEFKPMSQSKYPCEIIMIHDSRYVYVIVSMSIKQYADVDAINKKIEAFYANKDNNEMMEDLFLNDGNGSLIYASAIKCRLDDSKQSNKGELPNKTCKETSGLMLVSIVNGISTLSKYKEYIGMYRYDRLYDKNHDDENTLYAWHRAWHTDTTKLAKELCANIDSDNEKTLGSSEFNRTNSIINFGYKCWSTVDRKEITLDCSVEFNKEKQETLIEINGMKLLGINIKVSKKLNVLDDVTSFNELSADDKIELLEKINKFNSELSEESRNASIILSKDKEGNDILIYREGHTVYNKQQFRYLDLNSILHDALFNSYLRFNNHFGMMSI